MLFPFQSLRYGVRLSIIGTSEHALCELTFENWNRDQRLPSLTLIRSRFFEKLLADR